MGRRKKQSGLCKLVLCLGIQLGINWSNGLAGSCGQLENVDAEALSVDLGYF